MYWFVLTISVWIAAAIVPGIGYDDWKSLIIATLILGVLNAFVKPILQILSIPFIVLTLGLFLVVINALLLKLTAWLAPGFHVAGFWPAVGGSLVISVISMFFGRPGRPRRRVVINSQAPPFQDPNPPGPPPGNGRVIDV